MSEIAYPKGVDYYKKWLAFKDNNESGEAEKWRQRALAQFEIAESTATPAQLQLIKTYVHSLRAVLPEPARRVVAGDKGNVPQTGDVATFRERVGKSWDEIIGLEETKRLLKTAVATALADPPEGISLEAPTGILLYGPPGTGKTSLAAAASGSSGAAFFNVPLARLQNMYFGESPKTLRAAFDEARSNSPSILFLDDIDTIVSSRDAPESSQATTSILGTLLTEMDGLVTKDKNRKREMCLVLAGTNAPWSLDPALLDRFQRRIYVPLPDLNARAGILHKLIEGAGHTSELPPDELARRTDGYSGRELRNMVQSAIELMIAEANPEIEILQGEAWRGRRLRHKALSRKMLETALSSQRPRTTRESTDRFARWENGEESR